MSLVRVKTKGQVTLPSTLREKAGLNVGDLLEAKLEKGKITLAPKTLVDRRIDEALTDIRKGRTYGPFDSADEMVASLKGQLKHRAKAKAAKRAR
ncbi:MAG: hypothetical protein DMF61_25735 [Blastocatellia bacterium AA13]|nr:MAG: hypothetical protein DMF61_25735 [Blastocatellia bacterium AA13]